MNAPTLITKFAGGIMQIRGRTWIALGLGLLTLLALAIWAVVALFGWLWGQGKTLATGTPEATRVIVEQVDQIIPGARETLGEWLPALGSEPPRDVSGTDIGPVARFPGLVRAHWQRTGAETTVRYEGSADYHAVLDHYAGGFVANGFAQSVLSATLEGERHEYRKDAERVILTLDRLPQGRIRVTLAAVPSAPTFEGK
ncbi:MAG: hypothetical protein CVU17_04245 [Betaproteobacteria bacterium HGW-Betaproteobacteria-11]|nr:MAG: hypothetical protein CVU17_04245 [Betaproteobacteria bacterium HGW-Betaproteobacteria-11]